jgi:hypothetical protein
MTEKIEPRPETIEAWEIAKGLRVAPAESCGLAWGVIHRDDRTFVRRVYRAGRWQWLSRHALDEGDLHGEIRHGDVIADYEIGRDKTPYIWCLVVKGPNWVRMMPLDAVQIGDKWQLCTRPGWEYIPGELVVPDPYWR